MYIGSWNINDVLHFPINTYSAAGAADADADPAYRVYENSTGTAILNGTMASLDAANTIGLYVISITLSAGNGFEFGKCYTIYIEWAVTAVTFTATHFFQIGAAANTSYISGDLTAADNAESFFDGTGYAGTNNVIPTVTTTGTATAVTTVNGLANNVITAASIAADAITAAKVADGTIDAATFASAAITAASIATDAIGSAEISAAAIAKIADAVLRRQCDNAEASSDGDTLDVSSLYGLIQQAQESAISGTTLTVKKTDGSTTLGTKTVTVDATTGNITAIS